MKTFEIKKFYQADLEIQINACLLAKQSNRELKEELESLNKSIHALINEKLLSKRSGEINVAVQEQLDAAYSKREKIQYEIRRNDLRKELYMTNIKRVISQTVKSHIDELPRDKKLNKRHFDKMSEKITEQLGVNVNVYKGSGINSTSLQYHLSGMGIGIDNVSDSYYNALSYENYIQENYKSIYQYDLIHDVEKNVATIISMEQQKEQLERQLRELSENLREYKYHNYPKEAPLNKESR